MIFETKVQGIPCQCEVIKATPAKPMRITGSGFGDAIPPEPSEFEFQLLDRKGYKAPWLMNKLTNKDCIQLEEEFAMMLLAERYGQEF